MELKSLFSRPHDFAKGHTAVSDEARALDRIQELVVRVDPQ
jgi:hypothetical protein